MILPSRKEEAKILTEIALKSKAHWGYSDSQMEGWRSDLTITPQMFDKWDIFHFVSKGQIVGFYCLSYDNDLSSLEFLFILPNYMGKAIGSKLLYHAFDQSFKKGSIRMQLLADPNAASFYEQNGFSEINLEESSVPGRFLPVMEKELIDLK